MNRKSPQSTKLKSSPGREGLFASSSRSKQKMLLHHLGISPQDLIQAPSSGTPRTQILHTSLCGLSKFETVIVNTEENAICSALKQLGQNNLPDLLILTQSGNLFATSLTASFVHLLTSKQSSAHLDLCSLARWGSYQVSTNFKSQKELNSWIGEIAVKLSLPTKTLQKRLETLVTNCKDLTTEIDSVCLICDGATVQLVASGSRVGAFSPSQELIASSVTNHSSDAVVILENDNGTIQITASFKLEEIEECEGPKLLIYCHNRRADNAQKAG